MTGSGSGLPDSSWINSSIFSALFKGLWRVVANRLIGQQVSALWHHEDCAHKENGTVNMEKNAIPDIRTWVLNWAEYSWAKFGAPFTCVSGSGIRSTPIFLFKLSIS